MSNRIDRISIVEIEGRLKRLRSFRIALDSYIDSLKKDRSRKALNTETRAELRKEINRCISDIEQCIEATEFDTLYIFQRPPAAGGGASQICLLRDIFNFPQMQLSPDHTLDLIDRSIGAYEYERPKAWIRTINPVWWLWRFVEWVSVLPFKAIGNAGFNQHKVESSIIGRVTKFTIQFFIFAAALLQVDYYVLDNAIGNLIGNQIN